MNISEMTSLVEVSGLHFPVVDYGSGQPVILLHGFPDSRHLWRHQIQVLGDAGFRVIAPDLRGFGEAPRPQEVEAYRMPILIQDVIGILDALAVEQTYIVGHDWGAALAWRIAAYHPERVQRFISLSVGHPDNSGWETWRQLELFWYHFFFQFEGVAEEWLCHDSWAGLRAWTRGQGDVESAISALSRPGALTAALNWFRAHSKPVPLSQSSVLPQITCPVLGIWSENDVFVSEAAVRNSSEHLQVGWYYSKMRGAGHWMMLEQPDALNQLILDFFRQH